MSDAEAAMKQVNIHQAKTGLSKLVERAEAGGEIVFARGARELLEEGSNDAYYSAASIWEIAIKSSLGRKDFRVDLAALLSTLPAMGLVELPVTAAHAAGVTRLL